VLRVAQPLYRPGQQESLHGNAVLVFEKAGTSMSRARSSQSGPQGKVRGCQACPDWDGLPPHQADLAHVVLDRNCLCKAFSKQASFSVRLKRRFPAPAINLPDAARSFGQDLARQRQPPSGVVLTEASTASPSNGRRPSILAGSWFCGGWASPKSRASFQTRCMMTARRRRAASRTAPARCYSATKVERAR
jgi:hypothetical protein